MFELTNVGKNVELELEAPVVVMFAQLVAVVAVPTVKLLAVPVNPAPEPLKPVAVKIPVLGTNARFALAFGSNVEGNDPAFVPKNR